MNVLQRIFTDHADAYLQRSKGRVAPGQRKVIEAIRQCRTGARGHHVYSCPDCGKSHLANSSCGDRHCPICQNEKAAQWVYRQQLRLLPCNCFMATFTIPEALRPLALACPETVCRAMFDCAAASLRTLEADPRFVGCRVAGFFGVLHTWGRQLQYHPHLHFVVPGGGLSKDRTRWIPARGDFLVHVRALSALFRGKMRAALEQAGMAGHVPPEVWKRDWVVHCKPAGDGRAVMKYLGAYVARVAVSASRIASYDGKTVRVRYQKVGSAKWRFMNLDAMEFIRRFLLHVLPRGFMKIRHYGFLSPNFGVALQRIREMIGLLYELLRACPVRVKPPRKPRPLRCPRCKAPMQWVRFLAPRRSGFVT